MNLGKYDLESYTRFLRNNPVFMSDIFHMISFDSDPDAVKKISDYFKNLDLTSPFKPKFPLHKNYIEFKSQVEEIIQDENEYSLKSLLRDQNYLDQSDVLTNYSKSAKRYDGILQTYWPYGREETIESLELRSGEKILEIGIGTGMNLQYYPDYCEVTGIDLNEQMLNEAKEKVRISGKKNVKLHLMDSINMEFPNNTFDKALSFWALCSMNAPLSTLQELSRVCKPQGRIVILEVVKSPIDEVATLQLLLRPVNRKLDHIYIEGFPVNSVPFDCGLDILSLLKKTCIKPIHTEYLTHTKWVSLIIGQNAK